MPRNKNIKGYTHSIESTKLYDVLAIGKAKQISEKTPISHFDIPLLADEAGVNGVKLKLGSRWLFEASFCQYILQAPPLLRRSKKPLEGIVYTIDQIADKIGFATNNSLTTTYKNVYTLAPTVYRYSQPA